MITFESSIREVTLSRRITLDQGVEPFARLDYKQEVEIKVAAFERFMDSIRVEKSFIGPIVQSPLPRAYRTTSRRRIEFTRGRIIVTHGDGSYIHGASPLEPELHGSIYQSVERLLANLHTSTSSALNHIILRGTYEEIALIVNVREISADVVRGIRGFAEKLRKLHPHILHAWIYHDPKGSRYYLDIERPATGVGAKKIFGASAWQQTVGELSYQVGVFSFTQVNLAMIPALVEVVRQQAELSPTDVLYNMYCGYGLFGGAFAKSVERVVAVDSDEVSVDNARYNIKRLGGHVTAIKQMMKGPDDIMTIQREVRRQKSSSIVKKPSVVILDPPRSGTPEGLIEAVAGIIQPRRVVEIFCGPDEISRSIKEWKRAGYALTSITPVDLFPGTDGIEAVARFDRTIGDGDPEPTRTPQHNERRPRR